MAPAARARPAASAAASADHDQSIILLTCSAGRPQRRVDVRHRAVRLDPTPTAVRCHPFPPLPYEVPSVMFRSVFACASLLLPLTTVGCALVEPADGAAE